MRTPEPEAILVDRVIDRLLNLDPGCCAANCKRGKLECEQYDNDTYGVKWIDALKYWRHPASRWNLPDYWAAAGLPTENAYAVGEKRHGRH